ncbi:phenylacetate-CoA ligase [Caldicellulosiruptor bescii]|uniref:Coenzyme F390 synthetase-like protein n=2 Tax=Caldicellulosiruptor bescii TaxID=31899 RepID=B9MLC2_CALBD|nr:phenylacetate--CoA ligase family protein [Caldicellulosiruptor bescii]ACM61112.1 coenzyme F390 synthetase-like protein [Caldicellulosiruptor bescii DSM 6725]PBC89075.1 phenylacetate-CoA ligase [Caldicellulosiruptor bescii]PBC91443.1 phenylacetate-CoA ligase [Caldicellulosiruptor bescii]PBD03146.1 phenylacetate-CoA ligase [Caldicellulosiruptor bescii]PBD07241.1 phenylacetate-CoA ligase [Caldicellulosiruptor bescii]
MDFIGLLIRNVFFSLMEIFKGNTIRKKLRILSQNSRDSQEKIEDVQREELKKLLLYCIEHVPAYKRYDYLKKEIESCPEKALKEFPILEKKEFSENRDFFLSEKADLSKCILNRTGGSTGEPVKFYMDRETVEWYEAARYLGLSWWGINIGDRCLMLWASRNDIGSVRNLKSRIKERILKNRLIISSWDINEKTVNEIAKRIKRFKPLYIYAYPSAVYKLAYLLKENGIDLNLKLKGVVTTAENLYEYQRDLIQEVFKCPVINEYGARDGGIIAYECPKGKMHLMTLTGFYEFVDIEGLENEKRKSILVTDLHNYVMPRLRYRLGDVITLDDEDCTCGVGFPTIKEIDGRIDEIFVTKNGDVYDSHFFNILAREMEGVLQYQLVQHDLDNMTLKIVKGNGFSEREVEKFIKNIKGKFGDISIKVDYVNEIECGPSGKVRYIVREYKIPAKKVLI